MKKKKEEKLKEAGFKVGTAEEFLSGIERPKPSEGGATYVSIKKVIETEEEYTVHMCPIYSPSQLQKGLEDGALNLQQSETVEPYVFVVDEYGRRVATLQKEGGCGPSQDITIEVR